MLWYVAGIVLCARAVLSMVISFPPYAALREGTSTFGAQSLDDRYYSWRDPRNILYYIDDSYNEGEAVMLHGAMMSVADNTNQCLHFREYDPDTDAGKDFLYISKTLNDGTTPPTCVTFLGRVNRAAGHGQKLVIHNGENGCMGSLRDLMRIIVNALGLRNEYRRPDRDQYIDVYPDNLAPGLKGSSLLDVYNESDAYYGNFPFDYFSITMPSVTKYAADNAVIYSLPGNGTIAYVEHLSRDDCMGLAWMYGCDAQNCTDPYQDVDVNFSPPKTSDERNVSYVLLAPADTVTTLTPPSGKDDNMFHVMALDKKTSNILGKQMGLSGDAMSGQVNVTFVTTGKNSSADQNSFVLNSQSSVAGVQPQSGSAVTLNLKNVSNATALIGIYAPTGYKGEVASPANSSALVVNLSSTDLLTTPSTTLAAPTQATTVSSFSQPLLP
ncbi:uncharacterized protein LOC129596209 [Paramacrobiotus metropolitanus]|uniref:uncharacterized protein LOC129596209 n=1 Tax=Paramacrobiotus metropolitanus TaxID=2943436 RepID=UPI0024463DC0|nr:uncharacterized protein LOC129596209 [Paramacrobiotus metropolitanus]